MCFSSEVVPGTEPVADNKGVNKEEIQKVITRVKTL